MTFSLEWDKEFREGRHLSRYPWSDLVSFVNRYANLKPGCSVLELGCGVGTNYDLFNDMCCTYCGVDGSEEATRKVLADGGYWVNADFTKEIPFGDIKFALIFDRAAVTHNDTESIKRCIELVKQRLKPGGKYIGIDWFSVVHTDNGRGRMVDNYTFTDYVNGPFKGIGKVHFSNYYHLVGLFSDFRFEAVEHKIVKRLQPELVTIATWNFCCSLK